MNVFITETPILGGKHPMRRETMKAIEVAREQLISNMQQERKGSKMQTLGASNPHNNNKEKHRNNTRITGDTIDQVFQPNGGIENPVCRHIHIHFYVFRFILIH